MRDVRDREHQVPYTTRPSGQTSRDLQRERVNFEALVGQREAPSLKPSNAETSHVGFH